MRILITGGAGFIGSHIQDAYIRLGHEVAVLDNLSSGKKENLNPKAKFYQIDICSPEVEAVLKEFQPELLNHHAAQINVRKSVADPISDCKVNGIGTLNLLEAGRKNGIKKIIFASSGGAIYGEQEYFPADEEHPTKPTSPYGITKLLGEKYLQFYQDTYGIPFVALRYANVYGPRQNPHGEAGVVAIFITKLIRGIIPTINGDGLQTRDYVFIKDVVQANCLALDTKLDGIYNIGTRIETKVTEIYQITSEKLNIRSEAVHGLKKAGEQKRSVVDYTKIKQKIDWEPKVNFERGIINTIEYFKAGKE